LRTYQLLLEPFVFVLDEHLFADLDYCDAVRIIDQIKHFNELQIVYVRFLRELSSRIEVTLE
jgi:hypothetical protein